MTTAATISAKLILEQSEYNKGLDEAEKRAASFSKKFDEIGKKMQKAGGYMTAGVTAPVVFGLKKMVEESSESRESFNAMNVVFGEASHILEEYGKNVSKTAGLSISEFNQMAAQTGALLKNFGFSNEDAAKEVINLTERAADMASMFNTDVSDAFRAIQSGLRGQTEPLLAYGVSLDAASVSAKAVSMGLADVNGELSKNAKSQAALALFYEQTDQFAGDFQRTNNDLANSTRILNADISNLLAGLGNVLLPLITGIVGFLRNWVDALQKLTPQQQAWIVYLLIGAAALGPLIMGIGSLITAFSAIIPVVGAIITTVGWPVILIIGAIALAAGLLYLAWTNNWGGIQEKVAAVWAYIQPVLQKLWDWLSVNVPAALNTLAQFWKQVLLPAILAVWAWMNGTLFPFFKALVNFWGAVFGVALKAMAGIWQNVLQPALIKVWSLLSAKLMPVFEKLSQWWASTGQPVLQKIAHWFGNVVTGAIGKLTEKLKSVTQWLNNVADKLRNMKLPGWMTPGSPTPWEVGLIGVNRAMKRLTSQGMAALHASLDFSPVISSPGSSVSYDTRPVSAGGNFSPTIIFQSPIGIFDEREIARKLTPVLDEWDRKRKTR